MLNVSRLLISINLYFAKKHYSIDVYEKCLNPFQNNKSIEYDLDFEANLTDVFYFVTCTYKRLLCLYIRR